MEFNALYDQIARTDYEADPNRLRDDLLDLIKAMRAESLRAVNQHVGDYHASEA